MRLVLVALLSLVSIRGHAQDWPELASRRMIVPYAAGGPVDTVGRITAQGLSDVLGQQVVIENIGGAGGMTGANRVAKAAPDGYTFLLVGSATHDAPCRRSTARRRRTIRSPTSNTSCQFADSARVLITRKDFPASTLQEFVAYVKEHRQGAVPSLRHTARARTSARCCSTRRWARDDARAVSRHRVRRCRT